MDLTLFELDQIEQHDGLINYARAMFWNRIKSPYDYKQVQGFLYYRLKSSGMVVG